MIGREQNAFHNKTCNNQCIFNHHTRKSSSPPPPFPTPTPLRSFLVTSNSLAFVLTSPWRCLATIDVISGARKLFSQLICFRQFVAYHWRYCNTLDLRVSRSLESSHLAANAITLLVARSTRMKQIESMTSSALQ